MSKPRTGTKPNPCRPRHTSLLTALALSGAAVLLAGCGDDVTRTLGLTRGAPDEFTVTTRNPLAMPPNFDLPLPQPGVPRPQESPERIQAEEALVPQAALGTAPAPDTPGQEALVRAAGPPAPPNIRQEVNAEASLDRPHQTLTERMMFWQAPPRPGIVVDATKESQRLRENAALGQSLEKGDTPIEQPKRKNLLGSLGLF
jgi:Protein of unknown function (DUF3035)